MRTPLIILIVIFSVSVVGLTLIPGHDPDGQPARMTFFDAFYFMSYTATTIGFGELPTVHRRPADVGDVQDLPDRDRLGLRDRLSAALMQDRSFRRALALQQFTAQGGAAARAFPVIAGYGQTGRLLGRSFDALGPPFVVIDHRPRPASRRSIWPSYRADVPGLAGDAAQSGPPGVAGLDLPYCAGVLALTDDDETNLAVTMAAALLRPDLPVLARTVSPCVADRMRAFGSRPWLTPSTGSATICGSR